MTEVTRLRGIITMLGIVRNRQSLVSTAGFRRVNGEGRGLVLADGLVSLASLAGRTVVAAAVTDARGMRGMTKRGFARLPGRDDAGRTELAERLLASQRTFAGDAPRATTPLPPGTGGTDAHKSGGETNQASLPGGPGPPPAIGPPPAASRWRFAADLLRARAEFSLVIPG